MFTAPLAANEHKLLYSEMAGIARGPSLLLTGIDAFFRPVAAQ